jgi:hypothetical protein
MKTNYRRPKCVITRPGSNDPWEMLASNNERRANVHDQAVAGYGVELLTCVAADLGKRFAVDRKDPEQRWIMDRKAAVMRRLSKFKPNYIGL